jgi:sec-independent protein translocase protein TatA
MVANHTVEPLAATFGLPEMLVILAIVVVLFGASKLPQLGKGLGEAIGNFKKAQRDAEDDAKEAIDATPRLTKTAAGSVDVELEKRETHV